ncbi:MAG: sodium-independent anion transporter, partial [Gammaproteobacteria bacterium]|nr:sodium-independent anion transporter [Gammaproteobacteria bacterium]
MINSSLMLRLLPFLGWLPISAAVLRADVIAGITGALVLVPKAMAYAQLSGLPVYFGLYVALVPALLGALWGSSRQLSTGPVAIVSLMTAAAITPYAIPFSEEFIGLALLLALMVGLIQFTLGAFKLGAVVNFVSHPVILGFMNAAAVIIALSQLDMLLGIPKGRSDFLRLDIWEMLGYIPDTHLPTLAMAVFAMALMLGLKKIPSLSKLSVLISVVVTIVVSAMAEFESKAKAKPGDIQHPQTRELILSYAEIQQRIQQLSGRITQLANQRRQAEKAADERNMAELAYQIDIGRLDLSNLEAESKQHLRDIRKLSFSRADVPGQMTTGLYLRTEDNPPPPSSDSHEWRIKKI